MTMAAAPPTMPVPAAMGPRVFACRVRGYALIGDCIYDGDVVLIDPDRPPAEPQQQYHPYLDPPPRPVQPTMHHQHHREGIKWSTLAPVRGCLVRVQV